MHVRRLLTPVGAGTLAAAVILAGTPAVATAAPIAPKGLTVARVTTDVRKIQMNWKPVTDADHYVVDIVAGDVQTVINLPASTTAYTIDAPDACTSFKMRVGAADAAGATTNTGYTFVKSLTPSTVMGMVTERQEEGAVAAATWRVPAWTGHTPLTGYHVVFTRMADNMVLSDTTGPDTTFRFPGVDPARAYTLSVTSVNGYGECWTAKSLVDRFRPAEPTGLVVQRRADAPGTVELLWHAPSYGPPPTYYQVGYGQSKITNLVRVDPATTSQTLSLDATRSWTIELKAYNVNGGSNAVSGFVPMLESTSPTPVPAPTDTSTPSPTTPAPTPSTSSTSTTPPGSPDVEFSTDPTTTTTTVDAGPDRTPPTITTTLSTAPYNGWFRNPVTIHFTCADTSGKVAACPADIRVATDGMMQRFSGTAVDAAGNTATITLPVTVDQVPPTISPTLTGTKNAAGWYAAPPTVHYSCSDTVSGVATLKTCPAATPVTVDGAEQKVTGTALDKAGNTATATVVVNLDQVAPRITAAVVGDANTDGWYTTTPRVHFTCTDDVSGIAECPADRTLGSDGGGQQVSGTAVDRAGHSAVTTVTLNVDRGAPVITASLVGGPNAGGWHRTAPTVHFTCTDEISGLRTCPADVTVDADTAVAGRRVTGTAVDTAGNTASATVMVKLDRTAPVITAAVLGEPNADGWHRTAPTIHFTCTDDGAGIIDCPQDTVVGTDGAAQTVSGTTTDAAGNTATTSLTVKLDRTAPVITAEVLGDPNADGWHRTAPTIHFTCTDNIAGISECPADVTVDADTATTGRQIAGTAVDAAGNTATTGVTVKLDRTAPVITAAVIGDANAAGWYRTAPTVHFTCTDAGSGSSGCPADTVVGTDGAAQAVSGTTVDTAGNTTTTSVTVNVDRIAPQITSSVDGTRSPAGWYRGTPTVQFTCTDEDSAIASCPAATPVAAEGAGIQVPGTAVDRAGNTSTRTVSVDIDRTAPAVAVVGATNGTVYGAEATPSVSCATTDGGSGVAAEATVTHTQTFGGGHTVVCAGGVDKAGNTASPVTLSYTVQPTIKWLSSLTHEYLAGVNPATLKELDAALVKRQFSLYAVRVTALALGKKPALTFSQAVSLIYWTFML